MEALSGAEQFLRRRVEAQQVWSPPLDEYRRAAPLQQCGGPGKDVCFGALDIDLDQRHVGFRQLPPRFVERNDRYLLVEKVGHAGEVARRLAAKAPGK